MQYKLWDEHFYRQEICAVGRRLYDLFFIAGNDGNISVRLDAERILVTPSGVSKGRMKPEDMVVVSVEGQVLAAAKGRVPSSEHLMHLKVYHHRPEIRAVVHAHPPTSTGLAIAGVGLDRIFLPESIVRTGATPVVPYVIGGGRELPESLVPYLMDHDTLLLANHGSVAYAADLWDAQANLETVELTARAWLTAKAAGNVNYLTDDQIAAVRERYL